MYFATFSEIYYLFLIGGLVLYSCETMSIFIFPVWLVSNKSFCAILYDLLNKLTIIVPLFSACGPNDLPRILPLVPQP